MIREGVAQVDHGVVKRLPAPLVQKCIGPTSEVQELIIAAEEAPRIEVAALSCSRLHCQAAEVITGDLAIDRHKNPVCARSAAFGDGLWSDAAVHEMTEYLIDGMPLPETLQMTITKS